MKKISTSIAIATFLIGFSACSGETTSEPESDTTSSEIKDTTSLANDMYSADWDAFKAAVADQNKSSVLTFVSSEDPMLREAIDLSYEYIFDEDMMAKLKNMTYDQLEDSQINEEGWKEVSMQYIYEEDGEIFESATFLYFAETPQGLRIVNYLAAG